MIIINISYKIKTIFISVEIMSRFFSFINKIDNVIPLKLFETLSHNGRLFAKN